MSKGVELQVVAVVRQQVASDRSCLGTDCCPSLVHVLHRWPRHACWQTSKGMRIVEIHDDWNFEPVAAAALTVGKQTMLVKTLQVDE